MTGLFTNPFSSSARVCARVRCKCFSPLYVRMSPGALQIDHSEETDQGKYECVATNSEGTRYSTPANLYVRGTALSICHRFSIEYLTNKFIRIDEFQVNLILRCFLRCFSLDHLLLPLTHFVIVYFVLVGSFLTAGIPLYSVELRDGKFSSSKPMRCVS